MKIIKVCLMTSSYIRNLGTIIDHSRRSDTALVGTYNSHKTHTHTHTHMHKDLPQVGNIATVTPDAVQ